MTSTKIQIEVAADTRTLNRTVTSVIYPDGTAAKFGDGRNGDQKLTAGISGHEKIGDTITYRGETGSITATVTAVAYPVTGSSLVTVDVAP